MHLGGWRVWAVSALVVGLTVMGAGRPARAQAGEGLLAEAVVQLLIAGDETVPKAERLAALKAAQAAIGQAIVVDPGGEAFTRLMQPDGQGITALSRLAAAVAALDGGAAPVATCAARGQIVALADAVLDGRRDLTGFAPRRYGAEAAYLKIRYEDLGFSQAMRVLAPLLDKRPAHEAQELARVLVIREHGVAAGMGYFAPDKQPSLDHLSFSSLRAAVLVDDGRTLFEMIRTFRAQSADQPVPNVLLNPAIFAIVLADQPDALRLRVAQQAEAAGEVVIAGALFADLGDLEAFRLFRQRHQGNAQVASLLRPGALPLYGIGLRHGTAQAMMGWEPDDGGLAERRKIAVLSEAGYFGPHMDFLGLFTNMSGQIDEVSSAAAAYLAAVDDGRVDPVRDPDGAWLLQYRLLVERLGQARVNDVLGGFSWPGGRIRHYARLANETMQITVALDALEQAATGGPRTPPPLLADASDWGVMLGVADAAWSGRDVPGQSGADKAVLSAEILWRAGRHADAMDYAARWLEVGQRMAAYRDWMKRLDRHCEAHTAHPGQAMYLGGQTLFRL